MTPPRERDWGTVRFLLQKCAAASTFIFFGAVLFSDWIDGLDYPTKLLTLIGLIIAAQVAHWLFDDAYRRAYTTPPKYIRIRVRDYTSDVYHTETHIQGQTMIGGDNIYVRGQVINVELLEDKS